MRRLALTGKQTCVVGRTASCVCTGEEAAWASSVLRFIGEDARWLASASSAAPGTQPSGDRTSTGSTFTNNKASQEKQTANDAAGSSSSSSHSDSTSGRTSGSTSGSTSGTSSSSSANGSSSSSSAGDGGPSSEEFAAKARRMFSRAWDSYQSARRGGSSSGGQQHGAGPSWGSDDAGGRWGRAWASVSRELREAILPREESLSITRVYDGPLRPPDAPYEGPTAVAAVKREETRWEKAWADVRARFGDHPIFKRMEKINFADSTALRKGQEVAEGLRDRWETSDHPVVHKVEDVKDRLFSESDTAQAMKEIRARDPGFEMMRLMASVRVDAPVVVKAFLTHDLEALKLYCGAELMERFRGIFRHFAEQGIFDDPTILFVGDPELVEMRMVDDDPLIVVQFACQQIKCSRDKFGNVLDGSPNSIQRVFYFWGMQQEKQGVVTSSGQHIPPRWVLKDMMWQSILALV